MTFGEEIRFNENLKKLCEEIWNHLIQDKKMDRLPEKTKQKILDIASLYQKIENFWIILPEEQLRLFIVYEKRAVIWIYLMQKGFCNERGVDGGITVP